MLFAMSTTAQTVQQMGIHTSSEHIKVVFVADGFTSSQLSSFDTYAQDAKDAILGIEPYASNTGKFNFYKVRTASTQSGRSVQGGTTKNTYWNVYSNEWGLTRYFGMPSASYTALDNLLGDLSCGEMVYVVMISNDPTYGGYGDLYSYVSGRNVSVCIVPTSAQSYTFDFLVTHEFGHSFGDLDDEYVDASFVAAAQINDPGFLSHPNRPNVKNTNPGGWLAGARYVTNKYRYSNDLMNGGSYVHSSPNQTLIQNRINAEATVIKAKQFSMTPNGSITSACNFTVHETRWHSGTSYMPAVGDYVYSDECGLTTIPGGNKWFKVPIMSKEIKINSSGKVTSIRDCSGGGGIQQ